MDGAFVGTVSAKVESVTAMGIQVCRTAAGDVIALVPRINAVCYPHEGEPLRITRSAVRSPWTVEGRAVANSIAEAQFFDKPLVVMKPVVPPEEIVPDVDAEVVSTENAESTVDGG